MKSYWISFALTAAIGLAIFAWLNRPVNHPQQVQITPLPSPALSSSQSTSYTSMISPSQKATEPSQGQLDFNSPTLGITDHALSLARYQGKALLIYVFLATCPHCRAYYPNLELLSKKYQAQGLSAVMLCGTRSTSMEINEFQEQINPQLPILQDVDKHFQEKMNITMIPTVFLVNPQGHFTRFDYNRLNQLDSVIPLFLQGKAI